MTRPSIRETLRCGLAILVFALIPASGAAQEAQPENTLIEKTKLHIVTKDEIEPEEGLIGYDAQNGVVMGVLTVGQPANFLIVDRDPREDIEVLLDTRTHVVFAVRDGTIVRTTLPVLATLDPDAPRKPGWVAYTPPPMVRGS